jgi:hypothetical protein
VGAVSCVYPNPKTEHLHWDVRSVKLGQENVTQLASITAEGVGASLAVESSTTRREVFETYLESAFLDRRCAERPDRGDGQPLGT